MTLIQSPPAFLKRLLGSLFRGRKSKLEMVQQHSKKTSPKKMQDSLLSAPKIIPTQTSIQGETHSWIKLRK